jgi:hypothetical protein
MKPFLSTLFVGVILVLLVVGLNFAGIVSRNLIGWIIPFILVFSAILAAMNQWAQKPQSATAFVTKFMGTIIIKLFSSLIFLTIALYINKGWEMKEKIILSGMVFLTYIVFTIFLGKDQSRKNTSAEKGDR